MNAVWNCEPKRTLSSLACFAQSILSEQQKHTTNPVMNFKLKVLRKAKPCHVLNMQAHTWSEHTSTVWWAPVNFMGTEWGWTTVCVNTLSREWWELWSTTDWWKLDSSLKKPSWDPVSILQMSDVMTSFPYLTPHSSSTRTLASDIISHGQLGHLHVSRKHTRLYSFWNIGRFAHPASVQEKPNIPSQAIVQE